MQFIRSTSNAMVPCVHRPEPAHSHATLGAIKPRAKRELLVDDRITTTYASVLITITMGRKGAIEC